MRIIMKLKLFGSLTAVLLLSLASRSAFAADSPKPTPPASSDSKKPSAESKAYKNVNVEDFAKLSSDKKNIVLDVRTVKEFQEGHIPGATNIDVNAPDFEKKVGALDKNKVYLVHCAAGVRSAKACKKMEQLNFSHLYNLESGFKGWEKAGKPVQR